MDQIGARKRANDMIANYIRDHEHGEEVSELPREWVMVQMISDLLHLARESYPFPVEIANRAVADFEDEMDPDISTRRLDVSFEDYAPSHAIISDGSDEAEIVERIILGMDGSELFYDDLEYSEGIMPRWRRSGPDITYRGMPASALVAQIL